MEIETTTQSGKHPQLTTLGKNQRQSQDYTLPSLEATNYSLSNENLVAISQQHQYSQSQNNQSQSQTSENKATSNKEESF